MTPFEPTEDELFERAIQLTSPDERRAFIEEACGNNAALRNSIHNLLECHSEAGQLLFLQEDRSFAENNPTPAPVQTEKPGDMIDRYQLIEQIGEGGFGVVYLAEQKKPMVRRVALKIIKLGMDTREVIARFDAERQALARMDHPNIAKVLDAGATETGRPYFVMEHVPGEPITKFCDQHRLTLRERLDLFMTVCESIQHAHQKGIIHRDIKPSNVLVTAEVSNLGGNAAATGRQDARRHTPKVIDFGIAKAMEQRLTDLTLVTRDRQFIGTPAYMSPEQASETGSDIDTRSDIYSLGVLLYEMLTGVIPLDTGRLPKDGLDTLRRTLHAQEPVKPSTRINAMNIRERTTLARNRRVDPTEFPRLLKGDLDWIVLKALARDRALRYGTAADFAQDIRHYLRSEPVSAVAPSTRYLLMKYGRRHRTGLSVATLISLVLVCSSVFSIWKAREAVSARQEAIASRGQAELNATLATEERNRARLQSSQSDRLVADQLLRQNQVARAMVYLARSLRNDPGNDATYQRLMNTLVQRHFALPTLHPARPDTRGLEGHFNEDGSILAVVHDDLSLSFVDTESGRAIRTQDKLQRLDYGVLIRFTRDGTRAVTMEPEGGLYHVWDLNSGRLTAPAFQHAPSSLHFKMTPDDQLIISSGGDGRIRFFDPRTGRERFDPIPLEMPQKTFGLADGGTRLLVAQGYRRVVQTWEIHPDKAPVLSPRQIPLSAETQNLFFLDAFGPDGRTLLVHRSAANRTFSGGASGMTLSAWDIRSGEMLWENDRIEEEITAIAWSADGTRLMTSFLSGRNEIRDGLSGDLIAPIAAEGLTRFWEGSDHQTWIGQDESAGFIHILRRETGQHLIPTVETRDSSPRLQPDPARRHIHYYAPGQTNGLGHLDYSGNQAMAYSFPPPTGDRFSDINSDWTASVWITRLGRLRILDHATQTSRSPPEPTRAEITDTRFTTDGKYLISLTSDRRRMMCHALPDLQRVSEFQLADAGYIGKWAVSGDGSTLAFAVDLPGDKDYPGQKTIYLWHPFAQTEPSRLDGFDGDYIDLAIHPEGTMVFVALLRGDSLLYHQRSGWEKVNRFGHDELIHGDFSPDGRWLAVASRQTGARVFDLMNRQWTGRNLANADFGQVSGVRFSKNSQRLFVTGLRKTLAAVGDNALRPDRYAPETAVVWDWTRGELASDHMAMEGMTPVGFSPDETRFLLQDLSGPKVMDLSPTLEPPPEWLYRFVEIYCGFQFDAEGKIEATPSRSFRETREWINDLADREKPGDLVRWCQWLAADRRHRTLSPSATITLPELVESLLRSGRESDLWKAFEVAPFDARVMGKLSGLLMEHDDPLRQKRAEWLRNEAFRLDADCSELSFANALSLKKSGNFKAAWDAMENTFQRGDADWSYHTLQARLLSRMGQSQPALTAYDHAITLLENRSDIRDWADLDKLRIEKIGLLRDLGRAEDLHAVRDQVFRIPSRDPNLPANLIDLTEFYNAGLAQDWQAYPGRNLALLAPGLNVLNGVPFDTRGIIQLQCDMLLKSKDTESLSNQYLPSVEGIPVNQQAHQIHFLQASLYGSSVFAPKGTLVASTIMHYADGGQSVFEIKLGEQTRDWWIGKPANAPAFAPEASLELAWQGYINTGNVGLYKTTWQNPRPGVPIQSIDLVSAMALPGPFLVAITLD